MTYGRTKCQFKMLQFATDLNQHGDMTRILKNKIKKNPVIVVSSSENFQLSVLV